MMFHQLLVNRIVHLYVTATDVDQVHFKCVFVGGVFL